MVTLGGIQSSTFQAYHGAAAYDDALNFRSFDLALTDVATTSVSPSHGDRSSDSATEEFVQDGLAKRRGSTTMALPPPLPTADIAGGHSSTTEAEAGRSTSARPMYTHSSASHRLFRAAEPEIKSSWHVQESRQVKSGAATLPAPGLDSSKNSGSVKLRSSSWNAGEVGGRRPTPPGLSVIQQQQQQQQQQQELGSRFGPRSTSGSRRGSREDRPHNEILDGSDVLQQISNLTSTEPSNEREVFVGGLRESEDAVHITEEELATYFSKFGVIESVSINRDDRTHRGRGFAFVKFFQEAAALNAVVADASTHVIRGTTVSVQWSRGAKDAGSDRPRRRNSSASGSSSGNGSSPSRGSNRSSPKMGIFSHKGSGHRGGSSGSCNSGCSGHAFSPMRNRSHLHGGSGGGSGSMPYGFCNGGGHTVDHMNQPMVCVVVPAQRAAALGLSHHPGHRAVGSCSSRGSPPRDIHLSAHNQAGSAGGGGQSGYTSHSRSHSLSTMPAHGGGGYGHHVSRGDSHYAMHAPPHHVSPKASHSYHGGGAVPMRMPPVHHERRGRTDPKGYRLASNSSSGSGSSYADFDRSAYEVSTSSTSYPPGCVGDSFGSSSSSRSTMSRGMLRSQSPPTMMRAAIHGSSSSTSSCTSSGRNGGGAPRPPPTPSTVYDNHQYTSRRYSVAGPVGHGAGGPTMGDGTFVALGVTGRRHSGSSVMVGKDPSMRQEAALAAASYYYGDDDIGNERVYDRDYGYVGPPHRPQL